MSTKPSINPFRPSEGVSTDGAAGRFDSRVDAYLAQFLGWLERRLSNHNSKFVLGLSEFIAFGVKQAWACLFGGLLLLGILLTAQFWPVDAALARYDFLVLYALTIQASFLLTRLERPQEGVVILIFHIVGTVMELFKTSAGSWSYPEESLLRLGGVPLFSGFMYAAVGSYLARVWRTFHFRYSAYPPVWLTAVLASLIYINFFSHHYLPDIRLALFAATALIYGRTFVHYRFWRYRHKMPLLLGFFLVSLFIWLAENLGTAGRAWVYPNQSEAWVWVGLEKLGAWYLLMLISFVLVSLVHKPKPPVADE